MSTGWWLVLSVVLLFAEAAHPSFFFLFFGVAAAVTGFLVPFFGPVAQFGIWLGMGIVPLFWLRKRTSPPSSTQISEGESLDDEDLPSPLIQPGETGVALDTFVAGAEGRVFYRGTSWAATSTVPVVSGEQVTIFDRDGLVLLVLPVSLIERTN